MNPFRCSNCDKLLGMIEGKAEIKCSKCKTMNRTEDPYSQVMQPSNKVMLTFETKKADAFAGDIQVEIIDPITIKTSYDHESVQRLTRKEIEEKYGK